MKLPPNVKANAKTINPMALVDNDMEAQPQEITCSKSSGFEEFTRNHVKKIMVLLGVLAFIFVSTGFFYLGQSTVKAEPSTSKADVAERTVFVHLFEWKWSDIEKECVNFLGPKGFSAVQVSPPNEHVDQRYMGPDYPWWLRYQPVSYNIVSRSGSRDEFISMVQTCKNVGVDIYVDAIINHMAMETVGKGIGGSTYDRTTKSYPIYSNSDFNSCNPENIQDADYGDNPWRVRHCELNGLPDLNHDSEYVISKIVGYLQDLVDIGVAGFRIDAAKHMEPGHITTILERIKGDPYVFLEVIDYGGEAIKYTDYNLALSDVTEFKYGGDLGRTFAYNSLRYLVDFGPAWNFMDTLTAVVFIDNHDSQRGHGRASPVTHRSGALYDLTNVFMLANPYGYPKVMSSYFWDGENDNQGPPHDGLGNTRNVYNADGSMNCFVSDWVCEHRWRPIANMVAFRNFCTAKGAYDITNWWESGDNRIAFTRSGNGVGAGFVVINRDGSTINSQAFYTAMPDGRYCDIISSEFDYTSKACAGTVVTVSQGWATVNVQANAAFAIHGGAKLD